MRPVFKTSAYTHRQMTLRASAEKRGLIITQIPEIVRLALFQGTPLWEASLWEKVFRRSVAEGARLPQGTAMR